MNNASFVPNFAGIHTVLSCSIDALCFYVNQRVYWINPRRRNDFLTQMLGVFSTNLFVCRQRFCYLFDGE